MNIKKSLWTAMTIASLGSLQTSQAATLTWDPALVGTAGSDGSGTWGNVAPAAGAAFSNGTTDVTYLPFVTAPTTAGTAVGSNTITVSPANAALLAVGQGLSSAAYASGTVITAINTSTGAITLSNNATAAVALATSIAFSSPDTAIFGVGGTAGTVTVSGNQGANAMTLNATASGDYTFNSGSITLGSNNGATGTLAVNNSATINSAFNWKNIQFATAGKTVTLSGGSTVGSLVGAFNGNIGGSTSAIALTSTVNVTGGTFTSGGAGQTVNIGNATAGTGGLVFSGGTSTFGGSFQAANTTGQGLVTINGGTVNVTGQLFAGRAIGAIGRVILNTGTLLSGGGNNGMRDGSTHIGFGAGTSKVVGQLDINGGTFSAPGIVDLNAGNTGTGVNASTAVLNISGGTSTIGTLQFGGYNSLTLTSSGAGTVNLTGGTTYVGTGGIRNIGGGTSTYAINISGNAIVGASDNTSTGLAATLGSGGVTFQAANAASAARNITWGGVLSGTGPVTKTGGGTLTLNGANSYSGGTTINAGTVKLGVGSAGSQTATPLVVFGAVTAQSNSGTNTLTLNAGTVTSLGLAVGQSVAFAGVPAGTTITGIAGGTVTLSNNLTAAVGNASVISFLAVPTVTPSVIIPTGATTITLSSIPAGLAVGMQVTTTNSSNIAANTYITAIVGNVITLSTPTITGNISTAAILIFGNANQAVVSSTANLAAGQAVTGSFGGTIQNVAGPTVVNLDGQSTSFTAGTATFAATSGTLGSTSGTLTVNTGGTLDLNSTSQAVGSLAGNGGTIVNNATATASTLTVGTGNTSGTYGGVIANNTSGTGTVGLTKTGTGTQILTGANTYTGATIVNGGTLLINTGSLSTSSAVTVNNTATLGGTSGTVGAVTVNSGGTLSPGASIGTFNTTSVDMNGGSILKLELDNSTLTSDFLNVTGAFNLALTNDSVLQLSILGTDVFVPNQVYTLVDYGTWNGGLFTYGASVLADGATFALGLNSFTIDYDAAGGLVTLTAVPEPSTYALLGTGLLSLWALRRRSNKTKV